MDSTGNRLSRDDIEDAVVEILTEFGPLAELGSASLETIEDEAIKEIDAITRSVISKILVQQADQTEPPECCPRCRGKLGEKPAQGRLLQSSRGKIRFRCDVFRCEACRLDFFPSVRNTRL